MIGIYKLTNNVNGKIYIGQSQNLYNRFSTYKCKGKGTNKNLNYDINIFGIDSFSFEILYSSKGPLPQKDLNLLEMQYIKQFKSNDQLIGYNSTDGGESLSLKDREKLSNSIQRYWDNLTPEELEDRVSKSRESHKMQEYHIKQSINVKKQWDNNPERKALLSIRNAGANNPMARKVICIETSEIFGSIKEAQEYIGKSGIGKVVRGKSETCGGYHWAYL